MSRRVKLMFATALSLVLCLSSVVVWAQDMQERLSNSVETGEIVGLHGSVVMLDGERIAEAYFPGEDERWGTPIGLVDHGPETLHDLRSVTKSVVGLLYGIALSEGAVPHCKKMKQLLILMHVSET